MFAITIGFGLKYTFFKKKAKKIHLMGKKGKTILLNFRNYFEFEFGFLLEFMASLAPLVLCLF
jgi:hypothetical protein